MEELKNQVLFFLRDANPIVLDCEEQGVSVAGNAEVNRRAIWRVFDRVGKQVAQNVAQQAFIEKEGRVRDIILHPDDVVCAGGSGNLIHHAPAEWLQFNQFRFKIQTP